MPAIDNAFCSKESFMQPTSHNLNWPAPKYRPPGWVIILVNLIILLMIFGWAWWDRLPIEKTDQKSPEQSAPCEPPEGRKKPVPTVTWTATDLISAMRNSDPVIRRAAVVAVAQKNPPPSEAFAPVFEAMLFDESPGVKQAADYALQQAYGSFLPIPQPRIDQNRPWSQFQGFSSMLEDEVYRRVNDAPVISANSLT